VQVEPFPGKNRSWRDIRTEQPALRSRNPCRALRRDIHVPFPFPVRRWDSYNRERDSRHSILLLSLSSDPDRAVLFCLLVACSSPFVINETWYGIELCMLFIHGYQTVKFMTVPVSGQIRTPDIPCYCRVVPASGVPYSRISDRYNFLPTLRRMVHPFCHDPVPVCRTNRYRLPLAYSSPPADFVIVYTRRSLGYLVVLSPGEE